jgi:hypothetical protein
MLAELWRCTARLVTQPLSWSAWCAFDGAERGQVGLGLSMYGKVRFYTVSSVALWTGLECFGKACRCKLINHSLGQRACDCERRGVGCDIASLGVLRRGQAMLGAFSSGLLSHGNHLHGRRGRGFDAARWDPVCCGKAWQGPVSSGPSRKPPSCWHGGRSTRPWWDHFGGAGFVTACSGSARQCSFRWGWLCRVPAWQGRPRKPHPCRHGSRSTREVWAFMARSDSAWKVLLACVTARCVAAWSAMSRQCRLRSVMEPSSCRHGAGSTPAAWDESRQVPVGCDSLRSVWTRSDGAGQGCARFGGSWNENHHAVGAVPVSTPDGGMRLVTARPGKVRRGESRHGVVRPPSRQARKPLRRGGAELKGGQDGR